MSEMVERVARAISPHFFDAKDWADGTPIEREALENMRARAFERARAAIEAMREPTEAMLNAKPEWATHEGTIETGPIPINPVRAAWRAMIDVALTDPEQVG